MSSEALVVVDVDMIGMVKTNTNGLFKDTNNNLTKDWPGVS